MIKPQQVKTYDKYISAAFENKVFIAEIDRKQQMQKLFAELVVVQKYLFIYCVKGECVLDGYSSQHKLSEGCIITILPNTYIRVESQSSDCCLLVLAFDQGLLNNNYMFSTIINYIPYVIESPVIKLDRKSARIVYDYILVLIRASNIQNFVSNKEFVGTVLMSFVHGLGSGYAIYHKNRNSGGARGKEIVRELVRLITVHYATERSPAFYADLLHVSPQYLSVTVSKITGKKVTDIIAQLVIVDAQAKLKSTDKSIQQIAYSLNFSNVAFFGKYFKRYTGLSPRAFRMQQ